MSLSGTLCRQLDMRMILEASRLALYVFYIQYKEHGKSAIAII